MSDNKRKRGTADRRKVALKQDYEVAHVMKHMGVTRARAAAAIAKFGPSRRKVYAALRCG